MSQLVIKEMNIGNVTVEQYSHQTTANKWRHAGMKSGADPGFCKGGWLIPI